MLHTVSRAMARGMCRLALACPHLGCQRAYQCVVVMYELVSNLVILSVGQLVRYTVPPGDESGGEDAEDEDEESPPKKRAKPKVKAASAWQRGSGKRGGAGAYGGMSLLERNEARNKNKKRENRALAKAAREQAA